MIVAFSVTPLGAGEDVGEIEGEWDEVMAVVKQAVEAVAQKTNRVSMVLKADIRAGVTNGLTTKVEDLERYLTER